MISLALYIAINKNKRKLIFIHKNTGLLKYFFAVVFIVPILYQNWIGLVAGIGIILAFIFGLYLRSIMTAELYEKILHLICMLSITAVSCAVTENLYHAIFLKADSISRISAMFFYPNYYGTIISMVMMICAYKVLTNQGHIYMLIAVVNIIGIYLCKSIFVWVEVFIGIAVLSFILKKHRFLAFWSLGAASILFFIMILDINIIPRMSEVEITTILRLKIWDSAIQAIKASPFMGHGFMSYLFLFEYYFNGRIIPHSHNVLLELLMDVGIFGTAILITYFIGVYKGILIKCFKEKKTKITSLIIAVSVAALVHGIVDVTLMWIQTLPLFFIILSGIGAYEKKDPSH